MRSIPAQIKSYAPGFALALVIALLAKGIEALLPFDVIGASVIAMFIGMLINGYRKPGKTTAPGVKFTAKKILKFAIILLGASLNVTTILNVGRMSLTVMLFTLLTCFGGGYFIGRALGLDWKLSNLISAGTGICGGSAIAAVAPVIDAKDSDIAYALSATFLFDMAMIVLFPIMGRAMGLSDMAYGLWAGTAVNDTSSVDLGFCTREELQVPRGERYELCRSVHAEANAIISASRRDMVGGTIYLVGRDARTGELLHDATSCAMCRRQIINAGLEKVVIRRTETEFEVVPVRQWIDEDDSLPEA